MGRAGGRTGRAKHALVHFGLSTACCSVAHAGLPKRDAVCAVLLPCLKRKTTAGTVARMHTAATAASRGGLHRSPFDAPCRSAPFPVPRDAEARIFLYENFLTDEECELLVRAQDGCTCFGRGLTPFAWPAPCAHGTAAAAACALAAPPTPCVVGCQLVTWECCDDPCRRPHC